MVQPTESFLGNFDEKTKWFSPSCLFKNFRPKDNMV